MSCEIGATDTVEFANRTERTCCQPSWSRSPTDLGVRCESVTRFVACALVRFLRVVALVRSHNSACLANVVRFGGVRDVVRSAPNARASSRRTHVVVEIALECTKNNDSSTTEHDTATVVQVREGFRLVLVSVFLCWPRSTLILTCVFG